MKVSEAVASAVATEAGSAPIFSLIGDANLPIVGAIDRDTDATQWFARDEGAAVAMADGYSQSSDNLGIATVTSGPGLTHTATSLLAASRTRSSLVVVAGDTSMRRPAGLQEMQSFDQRRFVESCEAEFVGLRSPLSVEDDVAAAFHHARSDHTPLVLSVPLDLQAMDVPDGWTYCPSTTGKPRMPPPLGEADARHILDAIGKAQRPLVIAGRGAARSDARDDLCAFAQKIGALLGTTLFGKGLFDEEPWNVGVIGGFSNPAIQDVIRDADLVIAFGAELGHFTTQAGSLLQGRQVIRIDHEPLKTFVPRHELSIVRADARAAAAALCTALANSTDLTGFRTDDIRKRMTAPWTLGGPEPQGDLIDPRQLMCDLGEALPTGSKFAIGGGHFWSFPCIYMKQPPGARFLCPLGAAAVGQVLPFGIGVAAARPESPTLIIEGDGSLLMNIQELDTAARHKLPIVLLVMNDGALTAEALKLRLDGYDPGLAMYPSPDFATIARGFGWKAVTIDRKDSIRNILTSHSWKDGPMLIDARISREVVIDPVSVKDLSYRARAKGSSLQS